MIKHMNSIGIVLLYGDRYDGKYTAVMLATYGTMTSGHPLGICGLKT